MSSPSVNDYIYIGIIDGVYKINAYSPFSASPSATVFSVEAGFSVVKLLGFALSNTRLYFYQTGFTGSAPFKVSYLDVDCNVVDVLDLPTGYGDPDELDFNVALALDGTFMTALSHGGVTPPDEDVRSYDVNGTLINANLGLTSAVFVIGQGYTTDGDTAVSLGSPSPGNTLFGYSVSASGGGLSQLFELDPGGVGFISNNGSAPLVMPDGSAYLSWVLAGQVKWAEVSGGGLIANHNTNQPNTGVIVGSCLNVAEDGAYVVTAANELYFCDAIPPTNAALLATLVTFPDGIAGRMAVGPRLSCVPATQPSAVLHHQTAGGTFIRIIPVE